MGYLLIEGFENIRTDVDLARRFPEANSGVPSTFPTQVGMLPSSRCLRIDNSTVAFRTAALSPPTFDVYLGMGIRTHKAANAWPQIYVLNGSNVEQISIHTVSIANTIRFRLMRGATQLFISDILPDDVYYFLELQAHISPTDGSWVLRINEMTVGQSTEDVNTSSSGTSGYSKILFNLSTISGSGNFIELDNLYVHDSELKGTIAIENLVPIADTDMIELTLVGPANHYQAVDDASTGGADDDTSYVEILNTAEDDGIHVEDLYVLPELRDIRDSVEHINASLDTKRVGTSPLFVDVISRSGSVVTEEGSATMITGATYSSQKVEIDPLPEEDLRASNYGVAS